MSNATKDDQLATERAETRKHAIQVRELTMQGALLKEKLDAANLAIAAVAEKLRAVTEERDRYFAVKQKAIADHAAMRKKIHDLQHEAREVIAFKRARGEAQEDAYVDFVETLANDHSAT